MRYTYTMVVKLPQLNRMTAKLSEELRKAVAKSAFICEAHAKLLAPVDTGFMRASIVTYGGAVNSPVPNFDKIRKSSIRAVKAAGTYKRLMKRRPKGRQLSRVALKAPGKYQARVAGFAHYTVYQEKKKRFMRGAMNRTKGIFAAEVKRAIKRAGGTP